MYKNLVAKKRGLDNAERVLNVIQNISRKEESLKSKLVFMSQNDEYSKEIKEVFKNYDNVFVSSTTSTEPHAVIMFAPRGTSQGVPDLAQKVYDKTKFLYSTETIPPGKIIPVMTNDSIVQFVIAIPIFNINSIDLYVGMSALFRVLNCMGKDVPKSVVVPPMNSLNDLLLIREAYYDEN